MRLSYLKRLLPCLAAVGMCLGLMGCQFGTPTLKAKRIAETPRPNGLMEPSIWHGCDVLDLKLYPPNEAAAKRKARVYAVHDGVSFSIMVIWNDRTAVDTRPVYKLKEMEAEEMKNPFPEMAQLWVYDSNQSKYVLMKRPVDRLQLLWTTEETPPKSLRAPTSARFDCWRWSSMWNDFNGYADDGLFEMLYDAPGAEPVVAFDDLRSKGNAATELYGDAGTVKIKAHGAEGFVRWQTIGDPSRQATEPVPKPMFRGNRAAAGMRTDTFPIGSAGDVPAKGVYQTAEPPRVEDQWFVEFYRRCTTGDRDYDISILPDKGGWLILMMQDDAVNADSWYVSDPVRFEFLD